MSTSKNGNGKRGGHKDWPVRTIYYNGKREALKTTYAKHPVRAMAHATLHLTLDEYNASVAEIVEVHNSALPYAVYKRTPTQMTCVFKRDMTKYPLPARKRG